MSQASKSTSKLINSIKAKTLAKSHREDESVDNDNVDQSLFSYNVRGRLIYKNQEFSKSLINGPNNVIYWRCVKYRRLQCKAAIKSIGKIFQVVRSEHCHETRNELRSYNAPVWTADTNKDESALPSKR